MLRSVITPSCQMKAWDQLKLESQVLPTTWPRLLMPVAMAAKSPGRSAEVCECAVLPKRAILGCAVSAADCPNNLAPVVNAEGDSASFRSQEARWQCRFSTIRRERRTAAGSRVAYGLALIVDPKCVPVWIAIHRRKSSGLGFAVFPQHRQLNPIISCARRACGVHDTVFRKSCDLSTVIDRAGLPVISAERRESAHVEDLPKKRDDT